MMDMKSFIQCKKTDGARFVVSRAYLFLSECL